MGEVLVNRIYDVKVQGVDGSLKQVKALNDAIAKLDETKRKTDEQLRKAVEAGNASAIEKLQKKISELETSLKNLDKQRQNSAKEALLLAKAETEEAKAAAIRTKSVIDQDKELDRQIANEEKRSRQSAASSKAQGSNFYALTEALKKAQEAYRLFDASTGDTAGFETVKREAQEAKKRVDDFNRSLSPDGTLVGEYKTGILNAFKNLGLTDVIKKQKDDISNQIQQLIVQNRQLAEQYKQTSASGGEAFNRIEQELQESIALQQRLEDNLKQINTTMESTGTIGSKVTSSIKEGFSGLFKQATQFALGYLGFQQAIQQAQAAIGDAKELEGVQAAFTNLNRPDLLNNLRNATRGTVSDLELMKRAVAANNFEIPLEQLGTLMEFARRRAKDTGQSVDYLVDSIVTGIGRKSPLILDNLGISAVRLKDKMKGVAEENQSVGDVAKAVAQIIQEENAKAGKEVDTHSEAVAKNAATWANLRTQFGSLILPVISAVGGALTGIATLLGAIPWPIATVLLSAFTAAMVRNYVVTAIATKEGLIYAAYLTLQQLRTQAVAFVTRLATIQITLFNGAVKISPLGWLLTILGLVVGVMSAFASKTKDATSAAAAYNDVMRQANEKIAQQTNELDKWVAVVRSSATSADTKREAVQELMKISNEFNDVVKDGVIQMDKLDAAYKRVTESIRLQAEAEVSAQLSAQKKQAVLAATTARKVLETEFARGKKQGAVRTINLSDDEIGLALSGLDLAKVSARNTGNGIQFMEKDFEVIRKNIERQEQNATRVYEDYLKVQADAEAKIKDMAKKPVPSIAGRTIEAIQADLKDANEKFEKAIIGSPEKAALETKIRALRKELEAAQINDTKTSTKGASLSNTQKDRLKEIESQRKLEVAELETGVAQKKQAQQFSLEAEEKYVNNLRTINLKYIQQKIAYLSQKKSLNAEEKLQLAEFRKEAADVEVKTQDDLAAIRKRAFDEQSKGAQQLLDNSIRNAQQELDRVLNDADSSFTDKAKARQEFNLTQLNAQVIYNSQIDELEKKYGQKSKENEDKRAEEIYKILQAIRAQRRALLDAELADIQKNGDDSIAAFRKVINAQRQAILESKKSVNDKSAALNELDKQSNIGVLSREIKSLQEQLPIYKEKLDKKQITEKEYQDWYEAYVAKMRQLNDAIAASQTKITNVQELATSKLSKVFGFAKGSEKEKLLGQVIAESYQFAQDAMNSYYSAEKEQIEASKQLAYERIDLEKQQLLNQSQSQAERDSIERQARVQKEKADREAFEKEKKIRLAQAKINLAIQLANLAVIAFSPNPANIATLGVAGAIMYAIQAALAVASYAINVKNINSARYAGGGYTGPGQERDSTGHRVAGVVHNDEWVSPKWMVEHPQYGKIIRSLEAIRTGRKFAEGGYTGYGNMSLGSTLRPPVNPSSFLSGNSSSGLLETVFSAIGQQTDNLNTLSRQTNERIDKLKVQVVAKEVEDTNTKRAMASAIGTL